MQILGLHHTTLISGSAQRTVDFYGRVLGLRLIKKTVNFDAPSSYHLYFGDQTGRPGTLITFFEWPEAPRGHPGIGGTHHLALSTGDYDSLLRWKRRLSDHGLRVYGPYDRGPFSSIYFRDPDGIRLEIATSGPGWQADGLAPDALEADDLSEEAWPEPVDEITPEMSLTRGMHHISALCSDLERTDHFYRGILGLDLVKKSSNRENPNQPHWFWGVDGGLPGTLVTYFEENPRFTKQARLGVGQTHHFALAVADEKSQKEGRERLLKAGYPVTPVIDRHYFKSIYSNDPDGHIIELATVEPGFLIDEESDHLGEALKLPPWLEMYRKQIEKSLTPITAPEWDQAKAGKA